MVDTLSPSQKEVVESSARSLAVIAGAGSGKTFVLIERLRRLLTTTPGELDHMLVVTFTEKSAGELKTRLSHDLPSRLLLALGNAWIGTFHAMCARILRTHAPLMQFDPTFRILDENAARLLAHRTIEATLLSLLEKNDPSATLLLRECEYRPTIELLRELVDFRWQAKAHLSQNDPITAAIYHCFTAIEKALEQEHRALHAIDFQQLEVATCTLLDQHPDVLASYQKRFRHISVDEFQDTSSIQAKLIEMLHDPSRNALFLVGDPRQSIYRFRGANLSCFFTALERIKKQGGTVLPLAENFRSRPQLIALINACAQKKGEPEERDLLATRSNVDRSSVVVLHVSPQENENALERRQGEAREIARFLEELVHVGAESYGGIALLFQAMNITPLYESEFRKRKIPYRTLGGRRLLEEPHVVDLVSALRSAAFPQSDATLVALARSPLIGLSDDECALLAGKSGKDFRKNLRRHHKARPLLTFLEKTPQQCTPSELLRRLMDETGYEQFLIMLDPFGGALAQVDRLITMAESLESESPLSLEAFVTYLQDLKYQGVRMGDAPASLEKSNAVSLMTVHAAKGLEFSTVVLVDLTRQVPHGTKPWCFSHQHGIGIKLQSATSYEEIREHEYQDILSEHQRLFYVALTRAKERVVLPIHPTVEKKDSWQAYLLPHLKEGVDTGYVLPSANDMNVSEEKQHLLSFPLPRTIDHREHERRVKERFTVSEIEVFDRCPQEYAMRFLLDLPPARPQKDKALPPEVRGSIIHSTLERLTEKSTRACRDILRQQCFAHHLHASPEKIKELFSSLEHFLHHPWCEEYVHGKREVSFDWKVKEDAIVSGKIDWIREKNGGWEIVDFKTDRVRHQHVEKIAQTYALQLALYALALEATTGKEVTRTSLFFLEPGKVFSVPHDDATRKATRERLHRILKRLSSGNTSIGKTLPPCGTCSYHHNKMCWLDRL